MEVDVLNIPVKTGIPGKDTWLRIYKSSSKARLFEDRDAVDYGEAVYQLVEGCVYEYAFDDRDFSFEGHELVCQSKRGSDSGLIKTGIYVGTLTLKVICADKEVGKVGLEVKSVKMDLIY